MRIYIEQTKGRIPPSPLLGTKLAPRKVVQTNLEEDDCEMLSSVAKREGLTIKKAARRALLERSLSNLDLKQDPLFTLKPVKFRAKIRASEIDRFLYYAK